MTKSPKVDNSLQIAQQQELANQQARDQSLQAETSAKLKAQRLRRMGAGSLLVANDQTDKLGA